MLGRELVPAASAGGGHVTAMAFGYLVLVGMGIVEWRLGDTADALTRAGVVQVGALFVGGLRLTVGVGGASRLLGINVGLVGFVFGLALDFVDLKRVFSPVMGAAILLGLAVGAVRLVRTAQERAPAPAVA